MKKTYECHKRRHFDFICEEMYVQKKLEPNCKESIFKKLFCKLTTEFTFKVIGALYKQLDSVFIVGTLSVALPDWK